MKNMRIWLPLMLTAFICHGAPPRGWLTDPFLAQQHARNHRKPLLIVFSGANWCENSMEFVKKIDNSPELNAIITSGCVPLYVELEPAANWSDDFKRRLQATYPFLSLENGLPLPAIYFTDAKFRNLKIREPRFTSAGFRKAINQSREAMAAMAAMAQGSDHSAAEPAVEAVKPAAQPKSNLPKLTASDQMREANRQKRANRDPKGDPPVGWFTDVNKARTYAAARKLPIMVLVSGTDWCGPCRALRSRVLDTPAVQKLVVQNCVALYIHLPRGGWEQIRRKYPFWRGGGVPSFVFVDANLKPIRSAPRRVGRSLDGLTQAIRKATAAMK